VAGKTTKMIAKIAAGKRNTFFKENTLWTQLFVKDGSKTVVKHLKSAVEDFKVSGFKRVALG